jgi:hypothetical protein
VCFLPALVSTQDDPIIAVPTVETHARSTLGINFINN